MARYSKHVLLDDGIRSLVELYKLSPNRALHMCEEIEKELVSTRISVGRGADTTGDSWYRKEKESLR